MIEQFIKDYLNYNSCRDQLDVDMLTHLYNVNPYVNRVIKMYIEMNLGNPKFYSKEKEKMIFWEMFRVVELQAIVIEKSNL